MEQSTPDDSQTCAGEDKGMLLHDAALWGGLFSKQQKLTSQVTHGLRGRFPEDELV